MSCRELVELVTDYFEGALTPEDTRRFEDHLAECFWCGRYVEQIRVTIATVGRIEEESISPEAQDALLHAFRDWSASRNPS